MRPCHYLLVVSPTTRIDIRNCMIDIAITQAWHLISKMAPINMIRPSYHYGDVIMGEMASQITSLTTVYSNVYSGADQRKHWSSASLALVSGIQRRPVNSPHKGPVSRKMFPFDDVIMITSLTCNVDGMAFDGDTLSKSLAVSNNMFEASRIPEGVLLRVKRKFLWKICIFVI